MAESDRVAELKRKMQERAQQVKAQQAAAEPAAASGETSTAAAAAEQTAPAQAPVAAAPVAAAPVAAAPVAAAPVAAPVEAVMAGDGGAPAVESGVAAVTASDVIPLTPAPAVEPSSKPVAPAPAPVAAPPPAPVAPTTNGDIPGDAYAPQVLTPEERLQRDMTRRELLTYAWAGALGLVLLGTGVATFQFMYPRFKAGEFGGKFFLGPVSSMPPTDAPPLPNTSGKFWLVNTEDEGIKALYMVCTHLGCLYKWEPSTVRFECPCHGSKFSREGFYIEGPAPRSLDRFEVTEEAGVVVVDTGSKITGAPATQSPDRAVPA